MLIYPSKEDIMSLLQDSLIHRTRANLKWNEWKKLIFFIKTLF